MSSDLQRSRHAVSSLPCSRVLDSRRVFLRYYARLLALLNVITVSQISLDRGHYQTTERSDRLAGNPSEFITAAVVDQRNVLVLLRFESRAVDFL